MKLIVAAANLIMRRCPKVSSTYVTHFSREGNDDVMHCLILLKAITSPHFKFTAYIENEIAGERIHLCPPSTKYVCNKSS